MYTTQQLRRGGAPAEVIIQHPALPGAACSYLHKAGRGVRVDPARRGTRGEHRAAPPARRQIPFHSLGERAFFQINQFINCHVQTCIEQIICINRFLHLITRILIATYSLYNGPSTGKINKYQETSRKKSAAAYEYLHY